MSWCGKGIFKELIWKGKSNVVIDPNCLFFTLQVGRFLRLFGCDVCRTFFKRVGSMWCDLLAHLTLGLRTLLSGCKECHMLFFLSYSEL